MNECNAYPRHYGRELAAKERATRCDCPCYEPSWRGSRRAQRAERRSALASSPIRLRSLAPLLSHHLDPYPVTAGSLQRWRAPAQKVSHSSTRSRTSSNYASSSWHVSDLRPLPHLRLPPPQLRLPSSSSPRLTLLWTLTQPSRCSPSPSEHISWLCRCCTAA